MLQSNIQCQNSFTGISQTRNEVGKSDFDEIV